MNDKELHDKVHTAAYALMKEKGVVSPVEVLMSVGVLSKTDYDRWREGKIDYMERVCKINLRKLSLVNREIRSFAKKNSLKPSWTFYKMYGKGKGSGNGKPLRFSKSGEENIEKAYATHYISPQLTEEAKERRNERNSKPSAV